MRVYVFMCSEGINPSVHTADAGFNSVVLVTDDGLGVFYKRKRTLTRCRPVRMGVFNRFYKFNSVVLMPDDGLGVSYERKRVFSV